MRFSLSTTHHTSVLCPEFYAVTIIACWSSCPLHCLSPTSPIGPTLSRALHIPCSNPYPLHKSQTFRPSSF
ncbi:uncharacterized protein DS421_9g280730 [Arachis hypogaea]|nr:uncharacterized protein DS421_9g280730 [Arachis hypogaea]